MNSRSVLSLRAKTVIGVLCLKHYCTRLDEHHWEIERFCDYLLSLAQAKDIPAWDQASCHLALDGMGSPIPEAIVHIPKINEITCSLREITASQIYGAGRPDQASRFLQDVAHLCGVDLSRHVNWPLFLQDSGHLSPWGDVVPPDLYMKWMTEGMTTA